MKSKTNLIVLLIVCINASMLFPFRAAAQIPSKDLEAIKTALAPTNTKIEAALKTDLVLYNNMKKQMQSIMALKDTAQQSLALAKYRSSFSTSYGAMVKKAGVDMNAVVSNLNSKFPKYSFSVVNSYAILARLKQSSRGSTSGGSTTCSKTEPVTNFLSSQQVDCGGLSGASVTFGTRSINASTGGFLAVDCSAQGGLTKSIKVPAGACSLHIKYKLHGLAKAVSVGGMSYAVGASSLEVKTDGTSSLYDSRSAGVFTMVLWPAEKKEEEEFDRMVDLTNVSTVGIQLIGGVYVNAVFNASGAAYAQPAMTTVEFIR